MSTIFEKIFLRKFSQILKNFILTQFNLSVNKNRKNKCNPLCQTSDTI